MSTELEGKVAVVTGAGRGIGLATARELVDRGAAVVGAARTVTPELDAMAPESLSVDLTSASGARDLVDHAVTRFGRVDVLVNNVGAFTARTAGFGAISDEDWQRTFEVNFFATVRTIRAALPTLTAQGGVIVNVASVNGRAPQPPVADYGAAKAALLNLTVTLAQELGPTVQVTSVSPGPTATTAWTCPGGFGAALAEASGVGLEDFLDGFPEQAGLSSGRLTDPAEVAAVIGLLASGRVRNAHGADWVVDGGVTKEV